MANYEGRKDETVTPKVTPTTIVNDSGFKIDLPSLSGKPIDWYKFHEPFVATMEKRGKLSDPECCCLIKSNDHRRRQEHCTKVRNGR